MFSLPFMVSVAAVVVAAEPIGRAFRAALACSGSNQKVAADRAGMSQAQLSRQLSGGTLTVAAVRAQGPEFSAYFNRLLDDLSGAARQSDAWRESA